MSSESASSQVSCSDRMDAVQGTINVWLSQGMVAKTMGDVCWAETCAEMVIKYEAALAKIRAEISAQ
ncbi:hypothetical protein [Pseudomonas cannabina]|uniref:hypothetical protein n=1 Tax=Pseudomonas cannabina TaxID=86840 RepID=UPI000EFE88C1|nr:hypothetical protein [Pseudomonas cannabina]